MRNPDRINKIINYLKLISLVSPDVSFFGMLNSIFKESITYYIEDDIILLKLEDYIINNKVNTNMSIEATKDIKVEILDVLLKEWKKYPDLRFMQLVNNTFYEYEYRPNFYATLDNKDIYQGLVTYFI